MLKILFLTNNTISASLFKFLKTTEVVILFEKKLDLETMRLIKPDLVISYNYKYIIKKNILDILPNKFINLHISLLPWNRGAYPNVWSFIRNTPKGVTIHLINEGIDTGDIIFQKELIISENETFSSSYILLHNEIQNLFINNWNSIKNYNFNVIKQDLKQGSINYVKDFEKLLHENDINDIWDIKIKDFKKLIKLGDY